MSTQNENNQNDRQETLRQELLEYYFECHPDSEAMAERLASDAELAALYEEVKQTASLLEDAALSNAPPLQLTTPAIQSGPPVHSGLTFRKAWLTAAAAVAIALTPAVGIYLHRTWRVADVENSRVRLLLVAPPAVPDGSPLRFHVETHNLAQEKMVAQVAWKVLDANGATLTESTTVCDGAIDITASGTLNKPRKLIVTATVPGTGFSKTIEQKIHPSKSAPLVHVTSDKPAYRPGEAVLMRIACLDRLTLRGADGIGLRCRIVDPKDATLQTKVLGVGKGVTAWTFRVPPSAMGGTYALEIRDQKDKFTLERLEFLVRNFQPPKLKKKIVLDRQTYAVGQSGAADLHVTRAGGGAAAGAKVHATLIIDGDEAWSDDGVLDGDGRAVFHFNVPGNVQKGAARFVARVTDGGNVETQLEPFVIPTDKIVIGLYPEGGDLVAGSENRVYAQLRDALGRPLSGEGEVVDDKGKVVAKFKTLHMGRTRFAFTPVMGVNYKLNLTSPREKSFKLPRVHDVGAVLQPIGDYFAAGAPAKLNVFTRGKGPWIASVFCRGVLVGQRSILDRGHSTVSIPLVEEASGVLRVTVFDQKMRPVAERLVQRESKRNLVVKLVPETKRVTPGSKQRITVKTTDETGEPVSCVVGLTVTDRAVADMLDFIRTGLKDQQQLWTDVEKPDDKVEEFLSLEKHYRRNIDLLLGNMGWRRYVWRGDAEEKDLIAAGGSWAKALPAREGRSYAPLVTDTLASHQAELRVVHSSRSKAERLLSAFFGWSVVVFGLLGLTHVLVFVARRMKWRPPIVVGSTFASIAVVFYALISLDQSFAPRMQLMDRDATASFADAMELVPGEGLFFDDRGVREGMDYGDFAGFRTVTGSDGQPTGMTYVQDFDVQVAQGSFIADPQVDLLLDAVVANEVRAINLTVTGSDVFFMGAKRRGWEWGLGGQTGGGGGGYYRGPGDMVPPNPRESAQTILNALIASERAQRELRDLTNATSGLPAANRRDRIAALELTIREKSVLLDLVNRRYPAIFETLYPLVTGTISHVSASGDMLTIALQSGANNLKSGARFAVYNATDGYKGEATVSEVDSSKKFCFARLTLRNGLIAVGDHASTNLSATRSDPVWTSPQARKRVETILGNPALARSVFRYTHKASDSRGNFVETLFWQPFLVTNEKGEATVEFDVNDSITTWKIYANAHGNGRVGQGEDSFESFLPFSVDPKVPTRVSEGDVLQLPISIVADDASQKNATLSVTANGTITLKNPGDQEIDLRDGRGRMLARLTVGAPNGGGGFCSISIRGEVENASDVVTRRFVVVPRGFPHHIDFAGTIKGSRRIDLVVPDELAKRTGVLKLRFYPSPLANLEGALQGMLREPSGCFEQVSSSNYPNVMVLSMMQTSGDNVPAAAAKAERMLASGYKKLTAYEVSGGGFEWWGKKPAHAALTAYGLMQFADMARVFDVDKEMVARTRTWLLGKRDGKGGFVTGGGRYGHFMGGSKEARSAYIAYALLYSGEKKGQMQAEIGLLEKRAQSTENAYELAVAACALAEAKRPSAALARARLLKLQKKDGSLLGTGSITGSGPRDLRVETTAFAVLAWLAGKGNDAAVQRAVQFLEKQRSGGGSFGGTQATVMALKALTSYLNANTRSVNPGKIKVFLEEKLIAERELFGAEKRTIELHDLASHLAIGKNKLRVELTNGNEFAFSAEFRYRADLPMSSKRCALELRTYLTKALIVEGGTTALHAVVSNTTNVAVPSPMILVGLPAGLHIDTKILDDLKKAETIAAWEMTDRTIVLYLRGLEANESRDIVIDLVGRIPGTTKGPASRAYLYYAAREKKWTAPIEVTVTPAR
jgi:hypothetical protein